MFLSHIQFGLYYEKRSDVMIEYSVEIAKIRKEKRK